MAGRSGRLAAALAVFALAGASAAGAAEVTLRWKPAADPAVTGYRVHYGEAPGDYTANVPAEASPFTLTGLPDGRTWYFAVTSVDSEGRESGFSNEAAGPIPPVLFYDDFHGPARRRDRDWRTVSGSWRVTRARNLASSGAGMELALSRSPLTLFAGRLFCRLRFSRYNQTPPEAGLVFAWRESGYHRFVRAEEGRIVIGSSADGVLARGAAYLPAGQWHDLRADILPDGTVEAWLAGSPGPVVRHRFATPASGKVGICTREARAFFDGFTVWDGSVLP